jgi:hypothetical protein
MLLVSRRQGSGSSVSRFDMLLSSLFHSMVYVFKSKTSILGRCHMLRVRFAKAVEAIVCSRDGKLQIPSLPPDLQPLRFIATASRTSPLDFIFSLDWNMCLPGAWHFSRTSICPIRVSCRGFLAAIWHLFF